MKNLVVAWKYDTGEQGGDLESSPIIVGKVLYTCTPSHGVIALDAASGKLLWKWDATVPGFARSRGVSYWTDGHESRIFVPLRNFLFALDAATGKPIPSFGENGSIDLRKGLREPYQEQSVSLTTPGTVYKDLIIVGGQILRPIRRPRVTFAPSMCARAPCAGRFTPSLIPANLAMTPGPKTHGKMLAQRTIGPA